MIKCYADFINFEVFMNIIKKILKTNLFYYLLLLLVLVLPLYIYYNSSNKKI